MTFGSGRRPSRAVAKTCKTTNCGAIFIGIAQRKFCDGCQAAGKRASDRASSQRNSQRQKDFEARDHLSPAQVERVFQEALAQIRRERRFTADERSSHAWKYEEPGR
jgi:hypothetical protein